MPPPLPPLPFPYPLQVGFDTCSIRRIRLLLLNRLGPRFVRRVLAPEELPLVPRHMGPARLFPQTASPALTTKRPGLERTAKTRDAAEVAEEEEEKKEEEEEEEEEKPVGAKAKPETPKRRWHTLSKHEKRMYTAAGIFMAGRWAAKEAAIKAHPHRRLSFHDVLILPPSDARQEGTGTMLGGNLSGSFRPTALIKGEEGKRDQMALMSITHDFHHAGAVCLGFEPGPGDEGGEVGQGGREVE